MRFHAEVITLPEIESKGEAHLGMAEPGRRPVPVPIVPRPPNNQLLWSGKSGFSKSVLDFVPGETRQEGLPNLLGTRLQLEFICIEQLGEQVCGGAIDHEASSRETCDRKLHLQQYSAVCSLDGIGMTRKLPPWVAIEAAHTA